MGKKVLAVDLGGTNLRMAVVGEDGNIEHRERCSTPQVNSPAAIVSAIADLAELCKEAIESKERIGILGAAIPAIGNLREGRIDIAPNLPMLDGVEFRSQLEKALGLAVILENDATAAGIGEHWLGASRGFDNSICVTLGTGVGGGIILDGQPLRGPDGTAGEIGHMCVEPNGHPCGCGSWGCVEQYASATAVVRMAEELIEQYGTSIDTSRPFTAKDVYGAAKQGDMASVETFRRMGSYLGLALAGLVNALNPEVIVFAGGMSAAWDMFIDVTREQITKRAFREPALRVKLVRAELADDAGILGVASLALAAVDQGI
jgi:glucokinase